MRSRLMMGAAAALAAGMLAVSIPQTATAGTEHVWLGIESADTADREANTPAGPGEWDYKGEQRFLYFADGYYHGTPAWKSSGGKFKVCLYNNNQGAYEKRVYLKEYDPRQNRDDTIGRARYFHDGECQTWKVGRHVDGRNKKAELYISAYSPYMLFAEGWD